MDVEFHLSGTVSGEGGIQGTTCPIAGSTAGPGDPVWCHVHAEYSYYPSTQGLAVDAAGNGFAAAVIHGSGDLPHIFIEQVGPDGHTIWQRSTEGDPASISLAVDGSHHLLLAGDFEASVDLGGGPLASAGEHDIFIARLDPSGGHLWSKRFGDASSQFATSVAAAEADSVIVAGLFGGTLSFGGKVLVSTDDGALFVVKLDSDGNELWSKQFGDGKGADNVSLAVDNSGNVLLTGDLYGTLDFGGGPLTSAAGHDVFLAKLEGQQGAHIWSKRFGGDLDQSGYGVATDVEGNVVLVGTFAGSLDLGGGSLSSLGSSDMFVAKFDSAGSFLWSKQLGGVGTQSAGGVAVDQSGTIAVAGSFDGAVDLGQGPIAVVPSSDTMAASDIFVAKFDSGGGQLWGRTYGSSGFETARAIALDCAGEVLLRGNGLGISPPPSCAGSDGVLAKLGP